MKQETPPSTTSDRKSIDADSTTIADVMRQRVICAFPEMKLDALAAVFLQEGISGVPVVDDAGRPIGVVSKTDLLRNLYTRGGADAVETSGAFTVADIMMPIALVLPQNESLSRAAALMAFEGIHRVLVVRADGSITGIITALDVVRWLAKSAGFVVGD